MAIARIKSEGSMGHEKHNIPLMQSLPVASRSLAEVDAAPFFLRRRGFSKAETGKIIDALKPLGGIFESAGKAFASGITDFGEAFVSGAKDFGQSFTSGVSDFFTGKLF